MKKEKVKVKEKPVKLDSIIDKIKSTYGDVCFDITSLKAEEGKILPISLGMDIALQGGTPEGISILIAGVTQSGKTTMVLTFMAAAMQMDPEKECYYIDAECRLNSSLIATIPGLDLTRLHIIRSTKGAILHAEELMNIIEELVTLKPNIIVCLDSVAALLPKVSSEIKIGDSKQLTKIPTLMYDLLRRVNPKISVQKSNLILITHMQDNPTAYGGPKDYGGNAQKYLVSTRITCLSSKEFPEDSPKKEGRISTFKIIKSALSSGGQVVEFPIFYGKGYYRAYDVVNQAELLGLVDRAGAWYTLSFEDTQEKVQGKQALIDLLESNPALLNKLEVAIREMVFGNKT